MRLAITAISTVILLATAWAQNTAACTTATLRGTYSAVCTGFMSPAPGAPQVPFTALGVEKCDWGGNCTATLKASLGGMIVDFTTAPAGPAVVNSDCTGTSSADVKINGQPAGKLNAAIHILEDGKAGRSISVDAGATVVCDVRLMNR